MTNLKPSANIAVSELHIYVYIYTCIHTYVYVRVYVYTYTDICIYVCTCVYTYIYIYRLASAPSTFQSWKVEDSAAAEAAVATAAQDRCRLVVADTTHNPGKVLGSLQRARLTGIQIRSHMIRAVHMH